MRLDTLPGYTLVRKLPKGGLTDLYECTSPEGERLILRCIREQHKRDRALIHSFRKGRKVLQELDHPNIVKVVETGSMRRLPYMLIEYHESQSLREAILHRSPILTQHSLTLVRQMADALSYLHAKGYLHMDIKPENILVKEDATLLLIDFDWCIAHKGTRYQRLKRLPGTPTYLAPETIRDHKVDERSEVFAYGVVMYELLSGHKPFESSSVTEYKRAVSDPRVKAYPLHEHRPDISRKLEACIMKCLNKAPEARYPSMALVKRDLDALL